MTMQSHTDLQGEAYPSPTKISITIKWNQAPRCHLLKVCIAEHMVMTTH